MVKAGLTFNEVTRTSNTVVTITLPTSATYDVGADETITVTVPATAVTSGSAIVATPTFDVVATPIAQVQKVTAASARGPILRLPPPTVRRRPRTTSWCWSAATDAAEPGDGEMRVSVGLMKPNHL